MSFIPFNKPCVLGNELNYIAEALRNRHTAGQGPFTQRCETFLTNELGAKAMLTTSCTHALEMTALLLNIQPGDEVIVPSFGFVSIANAFALRGATIRFADIRADTLNIDESLLPSLITKATKAIVIIHYGGVSCEMDPILRIAETHGIDVVEDNAHGLFGRYKGKYLGSFGRFGTLSFHETKNFSCGEGGALLMNRAEDLHNAAVIRDKGTNRRHFIEGLVDKYTWVGLGSSYSPSDILAAFLLAQFEQREAIQNRRMELWMHYFTELQSWASSHGVRLPHCPQDATHTAHVFYLLLPSLEDRNSLMMHLRNHEILSVFHYQPLHKSMMGQAYHHPNTCPTSESVADKLLRLPLYNTMSHEEITRVVKAVTAWPG